MSESHHLSTIVLAAGLSKRMGDKNKLLLPYLNKTIIQHTLDQLLASELQHITIVAGFEVAKLKAELTDYPVNIVFNQHFEQGMTSSIKAGILASPETTKGWMICQGDMLFIQAHEYNLLQQAFQRNIDQFPSLIIKPFYQNTGGNPIIFSSVYKNDILAHTYADGCKAIVQKHQQHMLKINMPSNHILKDLDTPAAYMQLIRSAEGKKE